MKNVLGVDKTPSALERSFKAAAKVSRELPTNRDGKYTFGRAFVLS